MRWCSLLAAVLVGTAALSAQQPGPPAAAPDPALLRLRAAVNPEFPSWSPGYVYERVAEHLASRPAEERPYLRYFDMSKAPRAVLPSTVSALLFGTNSAS